MTRHRSTLGTQNPPQTLQVLQQAHHLALGRQQGSPKTLAAPAKSGDGTHKRHYRAAGKST
jgi:hypothetical protein